MRFIAAPWLGLLKEDVWLQNARHANNAARELARRLRNKAGLENVFPVESNAVFVRDWNFVASRLAAAPAVEVLGKSI